MEGLCKQCCPVFFFCHHQHFSPLGSLNGQKGYCSIPLSGFGWVLMVYSSFLFRLKIMLLRFLLLATTVFLVKTKVKANEDSPKKKPGPPPPSFVAVVPTSIMGDFDGALFPFLIEETTTTTTTTTPAPFGTFTAIFTILLKPSNSHQCCIFQKAFCSILSNESKQFFDKYSRIIEKWFSLWLHKLFLTGYGMTFVVS